MQVLSFVAVDVPHQRVASIAFTYSFPGEDSVRISGVGIGRGRGELRYLSNAMELVFSRPRDGAVLARVPLGTPLSTLGNDPALELPAESSFSIAERTGQWRRAESFVQHVNDVLNRDFPDGYRAYEASDRVVRLSTFADISGTKDEIKAQVAVLLTWHFAPGAPVVFSLRTQCRERRSHTKWRTKLSDDTVLKVRSFVDGLIADLAGQP